MEEPKSTTTFRKQTFEYDPIIRDLLWKDQSFDPEVAKYMPAPKKTRHLTKAGTIRKNKRRLVTKPLEYWKAQLIFRGLETKGCSSISKAQGALRGKEGLSKLKELEDIQKELEVEWAEYDGKREELREARLRRDEEEREVRWRRHEEEREMRENMMNDQAEETLKKKFFGENASSRVLVFTDRDQFYLENAAQKLKLFSASAQLPSEEDIGNIEDMDDWVPRACLIIGQNRATVSAKATQADKQTAKKKQEVSAVLEKRAKKAAEDRDKKVRQKLKPLHDQMRAFSARNKGAWDIAGKWKIECPYIEEQWGGRSNNWSSEDDMEMEIFVDSSGDKEKEIWAKARLGVIDGIFRFLRPEMPRAANGETKIKKRKRGDDEEGYEVDEDRYPSDSEEDNEIPDPDFKMPASYHPSSQNAIWRYRYRARETGEGEILLYEDENIYTITFSGEMGEKLSGTIQSTLFNEIEFTGHKIGKCSKPGDHVNREWRRLNENAYRRAASRRWG